MATHEPVNVAWIQKSNHMGKSSKRPIYSNSNTSSHESKKDIMGFHSGLFGNNEDVKTLHQRVSQTGNSRKDRNSSNVRMDFVPQTLDKNISLIDIDQAHISYFEEVFPDPNELSLEIEVVNRRAHQLISLITWKEMKKENEIKAKLVERDKLLR